MGEATGGQGLGYNTAMRLCLIVMLLLAPGPLRAASTQFVFSPAHPKSHLNARVLPHIKDLTRYDYTSVIFELTPEIFVVVTTEESSPDSAHEITVVRKGRNGYRILFQSREGLPPLERFSFYRDTAGYIVALARTSTADWIPLFIASDSRAEAGGLLPVSTEDSRCNEAEGDFYNPVTKYLSLRREANTVLLTFKGDSPLLHNAFPCDTNLGKAYEQIEFEFIDGDLRDVRPE